MPKDRERNISDFKKDRIRSLSDNGHTLAEIADTVGLSASTVAKILKE